jgi:hypothetical protein
MAGAGEAEAAAEVAGVTCMPEGPSDTTGFMSATSFSFFWFLPSVV